MNEKSEPAEVSATGQKIDPNQLDVVEGTEGTQASKIPTTTGDSDANRAFLEEGVSKTTEGETTERETAETKPTEMGEGMVQRDILDELNDLIATAKGEEPVKATPVEPVNTTQNLEQEALKYKSAEEFVSSLGINDDIKTVYNRLQYGRENANQFGEHQRLLEGEGMGQHSRGGASPLLGESNQAAGPEQLNSLVEFIRNKPEGFTVKIDGKVPTKGFAVSPNKSTEMIVEKVTPENLSEFISKNIDQLSQDGYHLGDWFSGDDGMFYLDVSRVMDSLDEAIDMAVRNDQIAVFDLGKLEEINTAKAVKGKFTDIYNQAHSKAKATPVEPVEPVKVGEEPVEQVEPDQKTYEPPTQQIERAFNENYEKLRATGMTKELWQKIAAEHIRAGRATEEGQIAKSKDHGRNTLYEGNIRKASVLPGELIEPGYSTEASSLNLAQQPEIEI